MTKKTVKTNRSGNYSTLIKDNAKGQWRAVVKADSKNAKKASAAKTVSKKSSGKAATKIKRSFEIGYNWFTPERIKFTGQVQFNAGGGYKNSPVKVKVVVQKKSGEKWKNVKTVTTSKTGKFKYNTKKVGTYRFVVKETKQFKQATSAAKKFSK